MMRRWFDVESKTKEVQAAILEKALELGERVEQKYKRFYPTSIHPEITETEKSNTELVQMFNDFDSVAGLKIMRFLTGYLSIADDEQGYYELYVALFRKEDFTIHVILSRENAEKMMAEFDIKEHDLR